MKKVVVLGAVLFVAGCGTTLVVPSPSGGSRADGIVELSYYWSPLGKTTYDETQALGIAASRCKAWGYTNAEKFGNNNVICTSPGGLGGCDQYRITLIYQCTSSAPMPKVVP
jgi:hypothetical protein